ncbi:MAG: amino acid adenylation domain-containing protein [Bacteroidota bacterium]
MQRLSDILKHSAEAYPTNLALEEPGGTTLSYAALEQLAAKLAAQLTAQAIGEGDRIGILLPKSIQSVAAIFGSLYAGATYIPVDVQAPLRRNLLIFADAQVRTIICTQEMAEQILATEGFEGQTLDIELEGSCLLLCHYAEPTPLELPKELAYLLYTSGSTGVPKGVMISHQNAWSFVDWCIRQFHPSEQDVFSSIAPFHFDLSIFDLYVGLSGGAKVVLFDQNNSKNPMLLAELIAAHRISVLYATPTLLKIMLRFGRIEQQDHSALRQVLFAGEVFPILPLKRLQARWSTARFYNLYGPTETNVVTWHPIPDTIPDGRTQPFPIGKSCDHVQCKIHTEEPGDSRRGELIVKGPSVAEGYLNSPEKNEEAYLLLGEERWYRTGDIVELDEDGNFVFVGRMDRMVKRRAYRIELDEIEAALHRHPDISDAGVVAYRDHKEELRIKAFLLNAGQATPMNNLQLMAHCLEHLPAYMLPDQFQYLDNFPKTSTHKIDYQQLTNII